MRSDTNSDKRDHPDGEVSQKLPSSPLRHNTRFSMGMTPIDALRFYQEKLSEYEKSEITDYDKVYFVGKSLSKHQLPPPDSPSKRSSQLVSNNNSLANRKQKTSSGEYVPLFDDKNHFYHLIKHDHIAYRFEVLQALGKGCFGEVVMALDHATGRKVALKIIQNEPRFTRQAKEEIRILEILRQMRRSHGTELNDFEFPIIQLLEHFTFRNHVCMSFELLSITLYDFLKMNKFAGLPRDRVRRISLQLLKALYYVEKAGIIHCDLKPENILLCSMPEKDNLNGIYSPSMPGMAEKRPDGPPIFDPRDSIKLIDFGSSCSKRGPTDPYIQSRFYRSPEVILRSSYTTAIDMWSFGCLVAELINGLPLFPGEDECDQLACIMEILGMPPIDIIQKSPRIDYHFIEQRCDKSTKSSTLWSIMDRFGSLNLNRDVTYLPRYCTIRYPDNSSVPELGPGLSKRTGTSRDVPGSVALLTAILQPKLQRFRKGNAQTKTTNATLVTAAQSPEEEAIVNKDNELLLSLMLDCLTWCPTERMKPIKAIQHNWLRNFFSRRKAWTPVTENGVGPINGSRVRSMEVSRMVPAKKPYRDTIHEIVNPITSIVHSQPQTRRGARVTKTYSTGNENGSHILITNAAMDNKASLYANNGSSSSSNERHATNGASNNTVSAIHPQCIQASPLQKPNQSVNAVSFSSSQGQVADPDTREVRRRSGTRRGNPSRRVTLVYSNDSNTRQVSREQTHKSMENLFHTSETNGASKPTSFVSAARVPTPNGHHNIAPMKNYPSNGRKQNSTIEVRSDHPPRYIEVTGKYTSSQQNAPPPPRGRPYSEVYPRIHIGGQRTERRHSPEQGRNYSVPYMISSSNNIGSAYRQNPPPPPPLEHNENLADSEDSGYGRIGPNRSDASYNSKDGPTKSAHIVVSAMKHRSQTELPAKFIQLVRTSQSIGENMNEGSPDEPKTIRINGTRLKSDRTSSILIWDETRKPGGIEHQNSPKQGISSTSSSAHHRNENDTRPSPQRLPRRIDTRSFELAVKPNRGVPSLPSGGGGGLENGVSSVTSLWAPQPYYPQPNHRRGDASRAGLVDTRPMSHYPNY